MDQTVKSTLDRNLIFVGGKGGVGKTVVSSAIAQNHANEGRRTLWVTIEDPNLPSAELFRVSSHLWRLNCTPHEAFEEYISLKLGIPALAKLFVRNKLMRYLAKAGPGIHELVLLGKIWYERKNYDHVVVDMPSTGFGLAMFGATKNFTRLFQGGRIGEDARDMMKTFSDATVSGHLIVALPEEMPLYESIELKSYMHENFPDNPCAFVANRILPGEPDPNVTDSNQTAVIPKNRSEYILNRVRLEHENLKIWDKEGIQFERVPYVIPGEFGDIVDHVAEHLAERT